MVTELENQISDMKAEFASEGIEEVVITLDNWQEYFEFCEYTCFKENGFGEETYKYGIGEFEINSYSYLQGDDAWIIADFEVARISGKLCIEK